MIFYVIFKFICGLISAYGIVWLFLRWKLRIYYERFKNVKTIPGLPLPIGHGHLFLGKNCQGILETLTELIRPLCGEPLKLWIGPFPTIILTNPVDISAVMRSPNGQQKHYAYRFLQNKTGLATAPFDQWHGTRKLLNPTFNFKMLQSFIPIFNECSSRLVRNLRKQMNGGLFECGDEILRCALSMACLTTLGHELHLQEDQNLEIIQAITIGSELITKRGFNISLYPDFIYNLTENSKIVKKWFSCIYRITGDIVQHKKEEYRTMTAKERSAIFDESDILKPKIFLTQILRMAEENNLSDSFIRDQVDTIMFAGSETSSETVANVVLALAMYPNIQERVHREIMEITDGADVIDYEMISKLVYTEMVIKEALRLYPPVAYLPRESTGDIQISNCTIPKGTQMFISPYNLHRDKTVWGPDSEIFNPDNFLPELNINRHPASFIPFGYGPRNCIATKYAMMSMKVMLCHILPNYKFTTPLKPTDLRFTFHLTLKLINRHTVSMTSRHN